MVSSHVEVPVNPAEEGEDWPNKWPTKIPDLWPAAGSNSKPAAGIEWPAAGIDKPAAGMLGIWPAVGFWAGNWASIWAGVCWAVQL